jgi:hypothetical protein
MTPAPKRRWFRYSLRTMFIAMTFGCWLGYNLNWIQERHTFLREQEKQYGSEYAALVRARRVLPIKPITRKPPRLLGCFGEKAVSHLGVIVSPSDVVQVRLRCWEMPESHQVIRLARSLFPEAIIQAWVWDRSDPDLPQLCGEVIKE